MVVIRRLLTDLPRAVRYSTVAATLFGVLGGLAGLVIGLIAYPPTAWFAVLEVGVPAAFLGYLLGLLAGSATSVFRRHRPRSRVP